MFEYLTKVTADKGGDELIRRLKKMDGAIDYDGNYSVQVYFQLSNGKRLRFGYNDDGEFFVDQYDGLAIKTKTGETKFI